MSEVYNEAYYQRIGGGAYKDSLEMRAFFIRVANMLSLNYTPKVVLDAGCAMGLLVEALRDLGIEAYGIDISEHAISQVREDIRPYCVVGDLTQPLPKSLPKRYDLVVTIEVLEHLYAPDGKKVIENLCSYTDTVIFSSTPSDFSDPTHVNVQQREYWAAIFAQYGFYDELENDLSTLTSHAMCFRKRIDTQNLVEYYERWIRLIKERIPPNYKYMVKFYFDVGNGYHENLSQVHFWENTDSVKYRVKLPANCQAVRYDPIEGCGCLVSELKIMGPSGILKPVRTNGTGLSESFCFSTTDPQIEILRPEEGIFDWISITATVIPLNTYTLALWGHDVEMLSASLCDIRIAAETLQSQNTEQMAALGDIQTEMNHLKDEKIVQANILQAAQEEVTQLKQENVAQLEAFQAAQVEICNLKKEKAAQVVVAQKAQEELDRLNLQIDHQRVIEKKNTAHIASLKEDLENAEQEIEQLQEKLSVSEEISEKRWKEIQDYSALVAFERQQAAQVSTALDAMVHSQIWRATKPIRLFLNGLKFCLRSCVKVFKSLRESGLRTTLQKVKAHMTGTSILVTQPPPMSNSIVSGISLKDGNLIPVTGNPVDAIDTIVINESVRRLNVVTDTIDAGSLLGGVATALIVATQFANQYDYELRIITRNTDVNPLDYENMMRISGIDTARKVSFYSDYDRFHQTPSFKLELSETDIFFATSWWSAQAIMKTTLHHRFFYIIQEVETFFYNYGDERMLCDTTMRSDQIDFIVNSGYLFKFFKTEFPNIVANGIYFEPAFPTTLYRPRTFVYRNKYKLFFYARPNNPRNLFATGANILNEAIRRGILDTNIWTIYCAGQNTPEIRFCDGTSAINLGQLKWEEYAEFLSTVDLGLCLMYTPHPSYPPYDVACSGGVVLSNRMCNKAEFPECKNVILGELESDSFMDSFTSAVSLAKNMELRQKNFEESTICRDWAITLEDVIAEMGRLVGSA